VNGADKVAALRLALFDCDGTLVDSQADICMAMESAYEQLQITAPDRNEIRRIVGLSVPEAVRVLANDLPAAQQEALGEGYKQAYMEMRAAGQLHEPLYDGVVDLLAELDQAGWMLGVATGKSDRGLIKCLEHHEIKDMFVTLQTADRHPSKPHPSMVHQAMSDAGVEAAQTVMIGDTTYDMDMARAAGNRAIGVSWGYHEIDELRAAGADAIAQDMAELGQHLEAII